MDTAPVTVSALAAFALLLTAPVSAPAAEPRQGKDELSTLIDSHLRSGGSWFTAEERAVIQRKCGYAPGEWDGFEANMSRGTFTCRNGRVVDDPEIRAVLKAAEPRIEARVEAVMARADVGAAIGRVVEVAVDEALRDVEAKRRR